MTVARRRSARAIAEWSGLAAAVVVFAFLGWDTALWELRLQVLLHAIAIGAVAGLVVIALRGGELPRTPIDLPLLGLLAAMALATASAMNVGMSLRAMAVMATYAAMLPVALLAIRHRPTWVGLVTSVPVLVLSAPTLAVLVWRRVEWILVGAPGLPPLRLAGEGTPFGSVAVPPFVIWPAWALAGLIGPERWRRPIRIGLVAVGIPMTILSGSRSAWLAMAVTLVVAGVPWAWGQRHRLRGMARPSLRTVVAGIGALAAAALLLALVMPRLTAVTSLLYRVSLWRDTLNAWGTDPLLGIGPGFMPYARQAAAPDYSFPVRQPHSHNLPLGILGDAGMIGLLAAVALVVAIAWFAGPWRSRTSTGRVAGLVLLGMGVGGLFEDLTFLPNFNLLAICLLAVALTDAGAVRWAPIRVAGARRIALAAGSGIIGAVLLAGAATADAGALAYHNAMANAWIGAWPETTAWLERAEAVDPWHPAHPKSLAVAADASDDPDLARGAAEEAVARNPGDGASWTNLAVVCAELGDRACQERATERIGPTAAFSSDEPANAAFSYEDLGLTQEADDAYRLSLLSQRLTALASDWPRQLPIGDATLPDDLGALFEYNRLVAWWAMDEPIDAESISSPAVRAMAHGMRGEREEAEAWLERAIAAAPEDPMTWEVVIVLRDHWGESIEHELEIARVVRGSPFPPKAPPAEPLPLSYDIASFRAYPRDELVTEAIRLRPAIAYPWALQEALPSP